MKLEETCACYKTGMGINGGLESSRKGLMEVSNTTV